MRVSHLRRLGTAGRCLAHIDESQIRLFAGERKLRSLSGQKTVQQTVRL